MKNGEQPMHSTDPLDKEETMEETMEEIHGIEGTGAPNNTSEPPMSMNLQTTMSP